MLCVPASAHRHKGAPVTQAKKSPIPLNKHTHTQTQARTHTWQPRLAETSQTRVDKIQWEEHVVVRVGGGQRGEEEAERER